MGGNKKDGGGGGGGGNLPQYMREKLGGGLIGEANKIRECWRTAFHRKRWVPVSRAGKTWKVKVTKEIKGWEKDEEEHWGQEEVSEI